MSHAAMIEMMGGISSVQVDQECKVTLPFGTIVGGKVPNGTRAWLGIPFALPPLRWKAPVPLPTNFKPPKSDYVDFPPYCTQPSDPTLKTHAAMLTGPVEENSGEDCLYLNIYAPKKPGKYSVLVWIHGGYLQYGSANGLTSQGHHLVESEDIIFVAIGYRLNAFGFLSAQEPNIGGNFGLMDQEVALQWVHEHIEAFGGDKNDISLWGLSAGAHSVHQLLHRAARLDTSMPFQSARMSSNAIVSDPKSKEQGQQQFEVFVQRLGLDPSQRDLLHILESSSDTSIVNAVENMGGMKMFRPTFDNDFIKGSLMQAQESGQLARSLQQKGFRNLCIGEVKDEWVVYAHTHQTPDIPSMKVYLKSMYPIPDSGIDELIKRYKVAETCTDSDSFQKMLGHILADLQVRLPTRLLAQAMSPEIPVIRYQIQWAPEKVLTQTNGLVGHGSDSMIWMNLIPFFDEPERKLAKKWLDTMAAAKPTDLIQQMTRFTAQGEIVQVKDDDWDDLMKLNLIMKGGT